MLAPSYMRCATVCKSASADRLAGGQAPSGLKPLVVVGSINADLVLTLDRVPAPGETLGASSLSVFPGGKGANQAAAAARLGYPTYFIGAKGSERVPLPLIKVPHPCFLCTADL